ncbi:MAG TPA: pilus assembly protein TadG-related protein [Terriglobales bacterium]|jgi:hypothetical protein|nr:pilus assembly protein TadG-related protein [Terriglobales bacterium]
MNGLSRTKPGLQRRSGERGQTIILVAVSLVSLLAMAALAIDVVTLYVARGEMQRAADAAALAGAKAFVDSGVTSLAAADPSYPTRQALAQTMATSLVGSILAQNRVSGVAPVLVGGAPAFDFTRAGNPQITLTLQRTDLPTFFARIWGSRLSTVSATAVAEAYNPANAPANYPPIAPKCVKPLLVANQDPKAAGVSPLVDAVTGVPVATGVIGELATLKPCTGGCAAVPGALQFQPAQVNLGTSNLCPGTCSPPASNYESSIDCCDSANPPATLYECGTTTPTQPRSVDALKVDPPLSAETNNGLQCVTNHPSEDTLDPTDLAAGSGPARITAGSGPQFGTLVTTSRSSMTLPIVQSLAVPPGTPVHIVGFLQVFIDPIATPPAPTPPVLTTTPFRVSILNVVGCGNSPGGGPAVAGGGYTPIPVRLIHQ